MDLATFDRLAAADGRAALAAAADLAPSEAKYPAAFDRLRKHFGPDLARAALDTALLRRRAAAKFRRAADMFFTREALEMATSEAVAGYRAGRFAGRAGPVLDLCCGIGGDAVGLAVGGCDVAGFDHDPLLARMADANVAAYGRSGRFVAADVLADPLPPAAGAFADPGRRAGGVRRLAVADYDPPVDALLARMAAACPDGPVGVKAAPGLPADDWQRFPGEVEFVSLGGELKECGLWRTPAGGRSVRATVLPGPHTLTAGDGPPADDVGPVGRVVYDPDPAVTRAGLVRVLAGRLAAWPIDPGIAFVSSDAHVPTPFASAYLVDEVLPFHPRKVGGWLKARGVGRVTVVKRGSAADADELAARWKLRGDGHRAVLLTRAGGEPVAIVGERVEV